MTTQKDIAKRLGVSATTVSLALRGDPQISEEMQSRVRTVSRELGYSYQPRRRSATKKRQIAYVAPDNASATDSFYSAILRGAEQKSRECGLALSFVQMEACSTCQMLLSDYDLDGLLLVGAVAEHMISEFKALGLPMVLVNNNLPQMGLDRILMENVHTTYRTVMQLAAWGHQRIAVLYGPLDHTSFYERLVGYRKAMRELDLLDTMITISTDDVDLENVEQVMVDWLEANGLDFSALVVCCDKAAIGAVRALRRCGYQVPEDVSVVGFDNIDMAGVVSPALTTNHVHRELLGAYGVQTLLQRIEDPNRPTIALTVDCNFIERDSTRSLSA